MFAKCWWLDVSDSKMLECVFGVEQVFCQVRCLSEVEGC